MKTRAKHFLLFFAILAFCKAWTQNPYTELGRLRDKYTDIKHYSAKVVYKVYAGHASQEIVDSKNGECHIDGSSYKLVLGQSTFLKNKDYFVTVDEHFKEIDVAPSTKADAPSFGNFDKFDSLLRKNQSLGIKRLPNGNGVLTIDLEKTGDEFSRVDITYNASLELVSISLFYRGKAHLYGIEGDYKPRVDIYYVSQNFSPSFTTNFFSESRYINVSGGKITPQPTYKNYQIFDLL